MTTIECRGVSRSFRRRVAIDHIDLSVDGGVIGVLGPNGAGKSTLLAMLATALRPSHGSVSLLGLNPDRGADRLAIRRRLGYLPQTSTLYPGFTVREIVDYVALLKEITSGPERRHAVAEAIAAVGLEDHSHRTMRSLSGGLRQRTALATALVGDPELLILDEPSAGLDVARHRALRSLALRVGSSGTVVMATHQPADVADWCDRVIVLCDGAIRFDGTPTQLAAVGEGVSVGAPHESAVEAGYLTVTETRGETR